MAKRRGNHEGSIHQRSNGTWRAQVSVNGQRLSYTGLSQKECRVWIKNTIRQIDNGTTYEGAQKSFGEFLDNWLISMQASIKPKTWSQYNQLVQDHIKPNLGKIKLIDLRPEHIQYHYDKKVKEGVGLRTVQLTHAVIHRSLNHAVKLGVIGRNPDDATTPPKPRPKEMKIYDEDQVQRLLITSRVNEDRFFALYQLAITTGMRQGELLGLKWQDVDWERRNLQIQRQLNRGYHGGFEFGVPKTKAGIRKIIIGVETANILKEHQQNQYIEMQNAGEDWQDNDLIFPSEIGTPMHDRNLFRRYKNLIKDAGLPDIRFHDLRHTAASLMLNHGVPLLVVSKRLGHAKPSITLDTYGHMIPSMQEQAADLMDEVTIPISLESFSQTAPELPQDR